MRMAFIGTSSITIAAARELSKQGHDIIIVEIDKDKIETLSEQLDCGFVHGDGTRPDILKEVDPENTEIIFCFTSNDQSNIIASLIARSLRFKKVVTKLEDSAFDHIAIELGLESIIVPSRTIAHYIADMVEGRNILEITSIIKGDARVFSFVVHKSQEGNLTELDLPATCRIICIYRQNELLLPKDDTQLESGDEVILITHQKQLNYLRERFNYDK
ncbi:TrkA family potassium uptake protein [Nitrosomonas sp.]|uniref:potassium channel family protein n=1 Tax=Nitrosomonas sp. TaxID=42353 RepID=UPI001D6B1376|nr:TrkA family potassium uptake protein [Nitrosomonas sp.]MCB1949545.1 TrkA family potassium uptake protein [Nitrosomonas sp.]MCP5243050.1 TrkA family potassium uptake protein [Burkholderiales bacterium]MDR4514958.1 TrkA family potassium uptake protein [Nitrosomonas sp.]